MRNVLIVATTSYAGMGPYVSEIANGFKPEENVHFLFLDYEDNFYRKNIKEELHRKCYFYRQKNNKWNKLISIWFGDIRFENLVIKICKDERIDVIHYINEPVSYRLAPRLLSMNIKILGTIHDLHPHEMRLPFYKAYRRKKRMEYLNRSTEICTNLVTNSKSQYDEMRSLFIHKNIFFHPFPSLVTEEIIDGNEIVKEIENIRKPYILFFGRLEKYKGVDFLCRAFLKSSYLSSNFKLVIAGKGDMVIPSNQGKIISINRYIKDAEIKYLYKNAACAVYPYISGTQSGVLSLAYYFGTPTLASDIPFFVSTIKDLGVGNLFKTNDEDSLIEQLENVLRGDNSFFISKAREAYNNYYKKETIHKSLIQIYSEVE